MAMVAAWSVPAVTVGERRYSARLLSARLESLRDLAFVDQRPALFARLLLVAGLVAPLLLLAPRSRVVTIALSAAALSGLFACACLCVSAVSSSMLAPQPTLALPAVGAVILLTATGLGRPWTAGGVAAHPRNVAGSGGGSPAGTAASAAASQVSRSCD